LPLVLSRDPRGDKTDDHSTPHEHHGDMSAYDPADRYFSGRSRSAGTLNRQIAFA